MGVLLLLHELFVVFRNARDEVSTFMKCSAVVFSIAATASCLACFLVDPGSPSPGFGGPPPDDLSGQARERQCWLPDDRSWTQKFCSECHVWRPHRCGHCHFCGRCVLRLDHHCIFAGTCIGERNLRFFALFLLLLGTALMHGLCGAVRCKWLALDCWADWHGWIWSAVLFNSLSLLVCGSVTLWFLGGCYVVLLLADVDTRSMDVSLRSVAYVCRTAAGCPGLQLYCCGPVALKNPAPWLPRGMRAALGTGVPRLPTVVV
eukprot:NODE_15936_length_1021_cov_3.114094.p2 GENE.NODE_15936_length_1021_cov_3.114094~~NODE_15936_length_1021_cov_3.114094.p2  ORF type:complete len:261 (-),score=64.51 NODE_15936_length_1021_cov_3.114094:140-922(-)